MERRLENPGLPHQGASIRYGAALLALALATGGRIAMDQYFGDLLPYVLYFPAVAFAAYIGGRGPALFTVAGSLLLANFLFVQPRYVLNVFTPSAIAGSLAYLLATITIVVVTEMMRRANRDAEALAREAEEERRKLAEEVSERWAREKELRTSEEKFRAVAETAGNAIYIHDGQKLIFVNPAAEQITGYTREELLKADMWQMVHPEWRGRVMENARKRFKGEPCPQRYEYMIVHKDGTARWLDFSANLVEFEGRNCILATAFDVTDRKNAEATLRKTEKLAATGRLAATIAHEINNPLEAVTNLLYLMRTDAQNRDRYLEMAEQELKRVAHLTKQTLGFYRDTSQRVRTDISVLIEEVVGIYSARLAQRRIAVDMRLDQGCEVEVFPGELRQVFSNLVSNAADAMLDGGRLQVRLRRVHDQRTGLPGIRVTVADNGTGISPPVLRHMYEPFFTTKEEVGTGLGLWVTKGIVDKHEGRLRVRSSTGARHGTVFTLFLPEMNQSRAGEAAA